VAKAVAELAFSTTEWPVLLSLEMHCNPKQQNKLAKMMVAHAGTLLLTYEDLVATGRAPQLSPLDLRSRILLKGKVKMPKKEDSHTKRKTRRGGLRGAKSFLAELRISRIRATAPRATAARNEVYNMSQRNSTEDNMRVEDDSPTPPRRSPRTPFPKRMGSLKRWSTLRRFTSWPAPTGSPPKTPRGGAAKSGASDGTTEDLFTETVSTKRKTAKQDVTDAFYAACLSLRTLPNTAFLGSSSPIWPLPISSINEDKLLKELGLHQAERHQIEGLSAISARGSFTIFSTEAQLSASAIVRLAANPPPAIGKMQRRTAGWLLRPFPLGLRFSGNNMSPLPCWLAGAQHVALNMSNTDLPVRIHFAMFAGSGGYVLKPPEMRQDSSQAESPTAQISNGSFGGAAGSFGEANRRFGDLDYWPPPRERLERVTIDVLSLHNLPKRGEQRPRYNGSRGACHRYHPELSGSPSPPDNLDSSSPMITLSLHPIGGFCAVSETLPLPQNVGTQVQTVAVESNGLNAVYRQRIHCIAAEPDAAFVHVSVTDGDREVAFETAVLGRLRHGYRVLQLRGMLGTRIELCYLFVKVSFGTEHNFWATPRQQETQLREQERQLFGQRKRIEELQAALRKTNSSSPPLVPKLTTPSLTAPLVPVAMPAAAAPLTPRAPSTKASKRASISQTAVL